MKEGEFLQELNGEMLEPVTGYMEAVCHNHLSEELLNRPAPHKYWKATIKKNNGNVHSTLWELLKRSI